MNLTSADRYDRDELADSQVALIRLVPDGAKVLELGASTGYMSRVMRTRGCSVVAVEYDRDAVSVLKDRADEAHWGDLEDPETLGYLSGRRFDVVILADVLEHLRDPRTVLAACAERLNEDGRVLVTMPNVAFWRVRQSLLRGRWDMTKNGILDETHLRFFTRSTAEQMFSDAGFEVEHWQPIWEEVPFDARFKHQIKVLWPSKQRLNARIRDRFPAGLAYQYLWSLKPDSKAGSAV